LVACSFPLARIAISHDARAKPGPLECLVARIRLSSVNEKRSALARRSEQRPAARLDAN
jgi:hypothetical protein